MLIHARKRCHGGMMIRCIDHMLIHLVGHHKGIILNGQFPDGEKLLLGEYLSAWIGGIADDDRPGSVPEALLHQRKIKVIFRRNQRDINGLCPGKDRICPVIFIKGREHHNLVARIADRHHGTHHGLRSAAGHDDLRLRVDGASNGLSLLFSQSITEILGSEGDGILMRSDIGCLRQRIPHFLRRIKIRKSLG